MSADKEDSFEGNGKLQVAVESHLAKPSKFKKVVAPANHALPSVTSYSTSNDTSSFGIADLSFL